MATFTNEIPPRLKLTAYEEQVRAQNQKGDGPVVNIIYNVTFSTV